MKSFWFVVLIIASLLLLLGGALVILGPYLEARIIPGVWIWGAPVGSQTPAAAEGILAEPECWITFVGPEGQRWTLSAEELGVALAPAATLAPAYQLGHAEQGVVALRARLTLLREGVVLPPVLVWERVQAVQQLRALASQIDAVPQDAGLRFENGELALGAARSGRQLDVEAALTSLELLLRLPGSQELALPVVELPPQLDDAEAVAALDVAQNILAEPLKLLLRNPHEGDPGPWTLSTASLAQMLRIYTDAGQIAVGLDENALQEFLLPLAKALYQEPVNARFHFDEATQQLSSVQASEIGRELDVPATVARINEQLRAGQHYIPLVLHETEPEYPATATAEELGIVELLTVGESYFAGSSSARDHNIRLGASQFDGVLIGPGATFSFNEWLGEVTLEEGYDESYVIVGDRTLLGVGGGICQVATTVFRAAFYGGYEIVERWPHAYRVGYYELGGYGPGFDATVYSPLVDFRFVNDYHTSLLIETAVQPATARLQFLFYGQADGREVEQIGPTWGEPEPPGPPVYEYNPELPSGAVEKMENSHAGLYAELGRVVKDAAGQILHEDRFVSHFVPWVARYRYGPEFIPPPEAEIVGAQP
ncbi:MAG: VanW family protein [Chloroflexota bacterium]|nr:VanW family protein [Chloroflexota bacterium]